MSGVRLLVTDTPAVVLQDGGMMYQPVDGRQGGLRVFKIWSYFEKARLLLMSTLRCAYHSAEKIKNTSIFGRSYCT